MNESKKSVNIPGLIVLFVAVTLVGVVLSYFYIIFQVNAHEIWFNIVGNFVFGLALAVTVWVIKRAMRISNDVLSVIVVVLSLAVIVYVMWNMWFVLMDEILYRLREVSALSDLGLMARGTRNSIGSGTFIQSLRYYNARGTWRVEGNMVNGLMLSAVWAGELLVMTVFAVMAAYASVGLYLAERGAWVKVKLMNYGFSAFDDSELDRLASGDIDVILQKPLETRGEAMSAVAVCYHKGEPTEFVAVYNADWDRDGNLSKGRHIMTVKLGLEKIDALDAGLQATHYPTVADKIAKENELENIATPISDVGAPGNDTSAAAISDDSSAANTEPEAETIAEAIPEENPEPALEAAPEENPEPDVETTPEENPEPSTAENSSEIADDPATDDEPSENEPAAQA